MTLESETLLTMHTRLLATIPSLEGDLRRGFFSLVASRFKHPESGFSCHPIECCISELTERTLNRRSARWAARKNIFGKHRTFRRSTLKIQLQHGSNKLRFLRLVNSRTGKQWFNGLCLSTVPMNRSHQK